MISVNQKTREVIERLRRDSDFQYFVEYLIKEREARRDDLESATATVQSHKLQGYCQAMSDLIKLCSSEHK